MTEKMTLATRGSPLALKQAELTQQWLSRVFPGMKTEIMTVVTTGDRKTSWSLEKEGGKGLFTKELEEVLLQGKADVAVHSAKDLPTTNPDGLAIAGFLPRASALDVMAIREAVIEPKLIATGSPRRRAQAKQLYPQAVWTEIRGNVETRLKKIARGQADATILAEAGLKRLGISAWPGIRLLPLAIHDLVPAVGQGAIALQTRAETTQMLNPQLDQPTALAVTIERAFLAGLGGGCHTAFAAHYFDGTLWVFHENVGIRQFPLRISMEDLTTIEQRLAPIMQELGVTP